MRNFKYISIILILITTSCKIQHKLPLNQTPNEMTSNNVYKAFVDQNGTFYPDNWTELYGAHPKNSKKYAYSLITNAKERSLSKNLIESENQILQEIKSETNNKNRIFILVHGYNNGETSAATSYQEIRKRLKISEDDYIIDFHWDGMYSTTAFGSMKIWFNAAGYSQLSGEYGLRNILNLFTNKEIFIISHSRGASVALSALSTPPYDPEFAKDTKSELGVIVGNSSPLKESNNIINCILLAPAVGQIDFKTPNYYNEDKSYRKFTNQLKQIYITVNRQDPKLKKYIGFVSASDKFNPTNLGFDSSVFDELNKEYNLFKMKDFSGMKSHAFTRYIENPLFMEILEEMKIETE